MAQFLSDRLRAEGNLSYLQFLVLVETTWKKAHPTIPLYRAGTRKEELKYPCILVELRSREPVSGEKKPRFREGIPLEGSDKTVHGWRFTNLVEFRALDDTSPRTADEVMEAFEDFLFEHTPLFKKLGVSEMFYGQREADSDQTQTKDPVAVRRLLYVVVTEKVVTIDWQHLRAIEIEARIALEAATGENVHLVVVDPTSITYAADALLV